MPEYSFFCESCSHKWSIVCSMSQYTDKQSCPSCRKRKTVFRDFLADDVYGGYNYSLSEVKTLGHYADKQTKKYGKTKCEDMIGEFKTKKTQGGGELPEGMRRLERPDSKPKWPGTTKKKKRGNKKR